MSSRASDSTRGRNSFTTSGTAPACVLRLWRESETVFGGRPQFCVCGFACGHELGGRCCFGTEIGEKSLVGRRKELSLEAKRA
eukprot:2874288-Rhodomonas_salina.1